MFHAARQMEAELITMTGKLMGLETPYGSTSSGGTESIMLAMYVYREWGRDKGIQKPNIVVCNTAHAAFWKAAHYYDIELREAKPDPNTFQLNATIASKLMDSNTVCIVGSAPTYCHLVIDHIKSLSALAIQRKTNLHVDACLGGFVLAFIKKSVPAFDFSLEGVTSMSVDHHKYGLAPKGISVVIYRHKSLRKYQYFSKFNWSGGIYVTPGF